jgi:hypothetical protein
MNMQQIDGFDSCHAHIDGHECQYYINNVNVALLLNAETNLQYGYG